MGQPYDELLYSLIISQLKDDGFYEEADSLQRKVVNAVFNIEASRQLRKIVETMSVTSGMSWRKLTTNSQCPQGVILNLKSGNESPSSSGRDVGEGSVEEQGPVPRQSLETSAGLNTSEHRIGEVRDPNTRLQPDSSPLEIVTATGDQDNIKEEGGDEQKWKKEMEHMRFDFKLSRKVDFKIHNFDPNKKRNVVEDKNGQKRTKISNPAGTSSIPLSQGKFFHLKLGKEFAANNSEEKKSSNRGGGGAPQNLTQIAPAQPSRPAPEENSDAQKGNLQDFLQKITIPMDKLN